MVSIGILKEQSANEHRVAQTPEKVKKLKQYQYNVWVEQGAGDAADFSDQDYLASGAEIKKRVDILKNADIVLSIHPLSQEDMQSLKKTAILIHGYWDEQGVSTGTNDTIRIFALEKLPRITRAQSMDVLSSQSNLAGYRAVIEACSITNRVIPMMTTASGTIKPARVLILGAGVAGLQAIATAKRLGAIVHAFDVRLSVKEQVESLGATFIEVSDQEDGETKSGYANQMSPSYQKAQEDLLFKILPDQDIVITTALIPGQKAPILITKEMVKGMKKGTIIVDLASSKGGNCALSEHGKTIKIHGVTLYSPDNILSHMSHHATQAISHNFYAFITTLFQIKSAKIHFDPEDILIQSTLIKEEISSPKTEKESKAKKQTTPKKRTTTVKKKKES